MHKTSIATMPHIQHTPLTIGRLAKRAGVGIETIRYYQLRGLIPLPKPSTTSANAYRHYPEEAVTRIRFIKRAQELVFSLDEIAELLRLHDGTDRKSIRRIAASRLTQISQRITDLKRMQRALKQMLEACEHAKTTTPCPIIAALLGESAK